MSRPQSLEEAEQDHELTRLFIANQLGPKPWRVTAWSTLARGRVPTPEQWEQAIGIVDMAAAEDVLRRARGGMVIRAAQDGWASN